MDADVRWAAEGETLTTLDDVTRPLTPADLVIVDPDRPCTVEPGSLLAKCHWSPFEGHTFTSTIYPTIVNGTFVYRDGSLTGEKAGQRLQFNRAR